MFRSNIFRGFCVLFLAFVMVRCNKDIPVIEIPAVEANNPANLEIPVDFPDPISFDENPLTEKGIALGRKLFYDPILSRDNSISCGSCHEPAKAFTDGLAFAKGIDDQVGTRSSMPLINLAWSTGFFWDGRTFDLETQALEPVPNPIEMHLTWPEAVVRLEADDEYPELFRLAFGEEDITKELVARAIAQFERTLVSSNSRFDQFMRNEIILSDMERAGFVWFTTEVGDCFHCHNYPLMTSNDMRNNGLDVEYADKGLGVITGNPADNGKFRVPTLRNIALTAPYMHDGRFDSLEEVIDFYSEGLQPHPNIDVELKNVGDGGIRLTNQQKAELLAFLHTLTDSTFLNNPDFQDPNAE